MTERSTLSVVTVAVNNVLVNVFDKQIRKLIKMCFYVSVFFPQFLIKNIKRKIANLNRNSV